MVPQALADELRNRIDQADHPRELAVEVMYALQKHYGYLSDEAVQEAASFLRLTPLEVEELATFYDYFYRKPVGRYVIHVCDGTVCWVQGHSSILEDLCRKLGVNPGETTPNGLFTLLPVCCIGYCDYAPAMLVNGKPHGPLTPQKIDEILAELKENSPLPPEDR